MLVGGTPIGYRAFGSQPQCPMEPRSTESRRLGFGGVGFRVFIAEADTVTAFTVARFLDLRLLLKFETGMLIGSFGC